MSSSSSPFRNGRRWYKRRSTRLVIIIAAMVFILGPWPVNRRPHDNTRYSKTTRQRIRQTDFTPARGDILASVAFKEITPPVASPLAGFGARKPNASESHGERMYVKALTLKVESQTVTIVAADILLVMSNLRREILHRLGVSPEEVFFTATHTHSGPGGFAPGIIEQFVIGKYDRQHLDDLAEAFDEAIRSSRVNLRPAQIGWGTSTRKDSPFVHNRIDATDPPQSTVHALLIRDADGRDVIATLVIAAPHATCLGKRNLLPHRDFPGQVQDSIEKIVGGRCLYAAGAVGSMAPAKVGNNDHEQVQVVGERLSRSAMAALRDASAAGDTNATLCSRILEVDLPPIQYRLTGWARLSPISAALMLRSRRTYIHTLTINDRIIIAMPADYSGELEMTLAEKRPINAPIPIISSFNGDYVGYIIPNSRYDSEHYESRDMNLLGPWAGEYFNDLAMDIIHQSALAQESAR